MADFCIAQVCILPGVHFISSKKEAWPIKRGGCARRGDAVGLESGDGAEMAAKRNITDSFVRKVHGHNTIHSN